MQHTLTFKRHNLTHGRPLVAMEQKVQPMIAMITVISGIIASRLQMTMTLLPPVQITVEKVAEGIIVVVVEGQMLGVELSCVSVHM